MIDPHDVIDTFTRHRPDAVELAVWSSPAVRVEPELLRALRLRLLPAAGAQAEADLWFSPLVRARGVDGIALHDDVLRVLRGRLRERWLDRRQRARAELAWATIERTHENASPALVLEERVAWLIVSGADRDRVDRELYRALRAIQTGNRPNLVRWSANAWRRLPPEAQKSQAGWLLGQVSDAARRGPVRVTVAPEGVARVDVAALIGYRSRAALGVRRAGAVLELGAVSGPGAAAIEVLDTEPRLVEVLGDEVDSPVSISVPSGAVVRVNVGDGTVRLITALHEVYELPSAPPDIFALLAAAPFPISTSLIDFRPLVDEVTRFFTGRQGTLTALDAPNDTGFGSGYMVITGEPGIGKTALLGHLVKERGYVHHFNALAQNITSARAFLGNVCAQLIVRYRLDHAALPAGAEEDGAFLSQLLAEAAARTAGEPVVVLVDALDEADPPARPDANPLFLPAVLPDNVFLIVTTRAGGPGSLLVERRRDLRLELDYAGIHDYVAGRLTADPDAAARSGMDVGGLASLVAERSQGNFLYAVLVTRDLLAGRPASDLDDLLPPGLTAYYAERWRAVKGADPERFRLVHEPVLTVLARADRPMSISDLDRLTGLARPVLEEVVREWAPFLTVAPSGRDERTYRLYHQSFREFVAGTLTLPPARVPAEEQRRARQSPAADPVEALRLPNGWPFVDRASLRMGVRRLMDPAGPNVLVVNGPPMSGKSYTVRFIRYIAEQTGAFRVLYVELAQAGRRDPVDVVREIVFEMALSAEFPRLDMTADRYRQLHVLARWLLTRMTVSAHWWWWVLDDCSFMSEDMKEFIRILVRMAERQSSRLRLILFGFEDPLGPEADPRAFREQLTPIGEREIRQWVVDLYEREVGEVTPRQVDDVMRALSGAVPADPTPAELSAALRRLSATLLPSPADPGKAGTPGREMPPPVDLT